MMRSGLTFYQDLSANTMTAGDRKLPQNDLFLMFMMAPLF